ncbi:MAG: hypothetical protein MZV70_39385 [Desulfobacterales bacterium]|nr:hypothetical protein [Desulfobacterales bacterium]
MVLLAWEPDHPGARRKTGRVVLDALVAYPQLVNGAEYIAAAIAKRWPGSVVSFIGERQAFSRTDAVPPRYDAVPFEVHQLKTPLAAAPDIMLDGARTSSTQTPGTSPMTVEG